MVCFGFSGCLLGLQVKLFASERSPLHSYAYFKNEEEERRCMEAVEAMVR